MRNLFRVLIAIFGWCVFGYGLHLIGLSLSEIIGLILLLCGVIIVVAVALGVFNA